MTVVLDASSRARHPEKAHRPDAPALKKPDWIRVKAPVSKGYGETHAIVRANGLHTVCEEAACPNIGECWDKKHATFMLMGDTYELFCMGQEMGTHFLIRTCVDRLAGSGAHTIADEMGEARVRGVQI